MKNLNLIFNKLYYSKIGSVDFSKTDSKDSKTREKATETLMKSIDAYNKEICDAVFNHKSDYMGLDEKTAPHQFLMQTLYPGLLIGSGNPHGAQLCNNDINNGFSFDYVSGQPYIPGSSVKGVLRSHFKDSPEAVSEIIKKSILKNFDAAISLISLEKEIFEGEDIFFDAVVYAGDQNGKIVGTDYITPHLDETKDPKPVHILKVIPNVRFVFAFKFTDGILESGQKCELMKILLEVFGVGAKTNTGYGRLRYTDNRDTAVSNPIKTVEHTDMDSIICEACGAIHILNDFEKDKIKNEGWKIRYCRDCRLKQKAQRQQRKF